LPHTGDVLLSYVLVGIHFTVVNDPHPGVFALFGLILTSLLLFRLYCILLFATSYLIVEACLELLQLVLCFLFSLFFELFFFLHPFVQLPLPRVFFFDDPLHLFSLLLRVFIRVTLHIRESAFIIGLEPSTVLAYALTGHLDALVLKGVGRCFELVCVVVEVKSPCHLQAFGRALISVRLLPLG